MMFFSVAFLAKCGGREMSEKFTPISEWNFLRNKLVIPGQNLFDKKDNRSNFLDIAFNKIEKVRKKSRWISEK